MPATPSRPSPFVLPLTLYEKKCSLHAGTARPRARCSESRAADAGEGDDDDSDADVMSRVVDWLPRAWQQVNAFLESRSAATHLTIGTIHYRILYIL